MQACSWACPTTAATTGSTSGTSTASGGGSTSTCPSWAAGSGGWVVLTRYVTQRIKSRCKRDQTFCKIIYNFSNSRSMVMFLLLSLGPDFLQVLLLQILPELLRLKMLLSLRDLHFLMNLGSVFSICGSFCKNLLSASCCSARLVKSSSSRNMSNSKSASSVILSTLSTILLHLVSSGF